MCKNTLLRLIICVAFTACSNNSISKYVSDYALDSCPTNLDDAIFDTQVADSYSLPIIQSAMEYEKTQNDKIRRNILALTKLIRNKAPDPKDFPLLKKQISERIEKNLESFRAMQTCLEEGEIGGEYISKITTNETYEDMLTASRMIYSSHRQILNGELPQNITIQEGKVFFCSMDKYKNIALGKRQINSLIHALIATIEVLYNTNASAIKLNGLDVSEDSGIFTLAKLPRKLIVSNCWPKARNSTYIYSEKSNLAENYLMLIGTSYSGIKNKNTFSVGSQYNPWYVNSFKLSSNITPHYLLWSHRFFLKQGYIPANFANTLGSYNELISQFEPVEIKNNKYIQPGFLVVIRNFCNTSTQKEYIINGVDGVVGLVMDYDQASGNMIILTEYQNFTGTNKSGLGYDTISLKPGKILNKELHFFRPKNNTPSNANEEKEGVVNFSQESNTIQSSITNLPKRQDMLEQEGEKMIKPAGEKQPSKLLLSKME